MSVPRKLYLGQQQVWPADCTKQVLVQSTVVNSSQGTSTNSSGQASESDGGGYLRLANVKERFKRLGLFNLKAKARRD